MMSSPLLQIDAELALKDNQDRIRVTILPKGGNNDNNAACLGGWQLMVSAYSKVPNAAADLVRHLSSVEVRRE